MSRIMTREEWLQARSEAGRYQHPPGWSYRYETSRLVATLEVYYAELIKIRTSLDSIDLKEPNHTCCAEVMKIKANLDNLGIRDESSDGPREHIPLSERKAGEECPCKVCEINRKFPFV